MSPQPRAVNTGPPGLLQWPGRPGATLFDPRRRPTAMANPIDDTLRREEWVLVQEVLAGSPDSFEPLVRRHEARVRSLCAALLQDATEADDAAQEVFLKAYRALGRFRNESSFSTWIHRIAHNHCLDIFKSRKRRPAESLDALLEKGDGVLADRDDGSPAPGRDLDIHQLLIGLSSEYRTVLVLREVQGFDYGEIAKIMSVTVDSVKARLRRARQSLVEKARHFNAPAAVQRLETQNEP